MNPKEEHTALCMEIALIDADLAAHSHKAVDMPMREINPLLDRRQQLRGRLDEIERDYVPEPKSP